MDRKFLRKTHFQGLRRVGVGGRNAQDSWEQINAHLETAMSAEHARLFSEPVVAADGTMDWYGVGDGDPRSLEELSESDRLALLDRFRSLHSEVQAHARQLMESKTSSNQRIGAIIEAALSFGQQGGQSLPVIAAGTQPVMVNWGTQIDSPSAPPDPLEDFVRTVDQRLPRKPPPLPPSPEPNPLKRVRPVATSSWLIWPAWALFAALLTVLFAMLLGPCGVAGLTGARLCPTAIVTSADSDPGMDALAAEVAGLEDALRRAPLCPVAPEPEPEPEEDELSEADRRRQEAGGQTGELTITLTWNSLTDLDLHVYCGGGHLYYDNRNSCGGELDVDANANRGTTRRPVENIFFSQLPSGREIRVQVHNYREQSWATDYRLEITMNGERQVQTGRLGNKKWGEIITLQVP